MSILGKNCLFWEQLNFLLFPYKEGTPLWLDLPESPFLCADRQAHSLIREGGWLTLLLREIVIEIPWSRCYLMWSIEPLSLKSDITGLL